MLSARLELSPAAQRKRRQRERERQQRQARSPVMFERHDWQQFISRAGLPSKAGCEPGDIPRLVLKELTDNALDEGAAVTQSYDPDTHTYRITDTGSGIAPEAVPRLFAVNRPLVSSKLKRLPLRGALGNGLRVVMGAVAAYEGSITVASRGRRQRLAVDRDTGLTRVEHARPYIGRGTTVEISLPIFTGDDDEQADVLQAIELAEKGQPSAGRARPEWFSPNDLHELLQAVADGTTVEDVVSEIFGIDIDNDRPARSLTPAETMALHAVLLRSRQGPSQRLGYIGDLYTDYTYRRETGTAPIEGARIPYVVEAYCKATQAVGDGSAGVELWINRSPCLAPIHAWSLPSALRVQGCTLDMQIAKAKKANYQIILSVIAPHLRISSDGKRPVLSFFRTGCDNAVRLATTAAYRLIARPPSRMSVKEAAYQVMQAAYRAVAANPGGDPPMLPVNARQLMYKARGEILRRTGREKFNDAYFTQTLVPQFIRDNPDLCANWDVIYDARGHLTEPHTYRSIGLGTLAVRQYVGERPRFGTASRFEINVMYPTSGPLNRYKNLLYIEKEGFDELIAAARIAERYDLAIASCKGMSVVAVRYLIDRIAPHIENVFVLHDFDVSGFSIAGTLTTDSDRYVFNNNVELIDLGLRLEDVEAESLESEKVSISRESMADHILTLQRHRATTADIDFLTGRDGNGTKRVELNAMGSAQFIAFIERKLEAHGVTKLIPDDDVLIQHARRLDEQRLVEALVEAERPRIIAEAQQTVLPDNLRALVEAFMDEQPDYPWDEALANLRGIRTR
jgi:hypothetical protein